MSAWTPNLREIAKQPTYMHSGHRLCAGCPAGIIGRLALHAVPDPENTVIVHATGCWEVATTIFPYTSWVGEVEGRIIGVPWIHNAFENAAATASGIERAFKAMRRKGLIDKEPTVIVFAGDGGTHDIGLQSLSGMVERGHDIVYIEYDNNVYANTGIQRSSATPQYAWTTTSPAGTKEPGKLQWRKPLPEIMAAHGDLYVATANPAYWVDFMQKVRKAIEYEGPAFIHCLAACPRSWRFDPRLTITISRMAVETCAYPLWEYQDGVYTLSAPSKPYAKDPSKKKPIEEWLKMQGRFSHLFKPVRREDLIKEIQEKTDRDWNRILRLCGEA